MSERISNTHEQKLEVLKKKVIQQLHVNNYNKINLKKNLKYIYSHLLNNRIEIRKIQSYTPSIIRISCSWNMIMTAKLILMRSE